MKKLAWLLLGMTLACCGLTCAPADPLPVEKESATVEEHVQPYTQALDPPAARPSALQERIKLAIKQVKQRDLLTTNGFWTVFHGILGLGPSVTLLNPETGIRVNAVDYICDGGEIRGMRFLPTAHGLDVQTGPTFVGQGHQDQYVAEMAQWGLPADRKFKVYGIDYTFMDFIRHTQMRARVTADQELSWAIVVIGQYLGTDISWTNRYDEQLHFDDVVRYELNADVDNAACGGTHRLFGLTWVYHLHMQKGGKKTGVWKDVADKTAKYQQLARKHQNPDGSFSTNFFRGPGNAPDMQLRMNTTGHTLEWLALSLSDAELRQPWVENAANALAMMFLEIQNQPMEGGTMYHAIHGLLLYYARMYGPQDLGDNAPLDPLPPME